MVHLLGHILLFAFITDLVLNSYHNIRFSAKSKSSCLIVIEQSAEVCIRLLEGGYLLLSMTLHIVCDGKTRVHIVPVCHKSLQVSQSESSGEYRAGNVP